MLAPNAGSVPQPDGTTSDHFMGGGTDYGACVGRYWAFEANTNQTSLSAWANDMHAYEIRQEEYQPKVGNSYANTGDNVAGIFARWNSSTTDSQIKDGTSNTIMTGELQRITSLQMPNPEYYYSRDGWAIGGSATGFSTGWPDDEVNGVQIPLINNADELYGANQTTFVNAFNSPGSDHTGGAHFGLGDGSVRWINDDVDSDVFALLGSMADKTTAQVP